MSPRREQPMKLPTNDYPSDWSRVGGGGGADGRKNGGNERQWRRSVMLVVIF